MEKLRGKYNTKKTIFLYLFFQTNLFLSRRFGIFGVIFYIQWDGGDLRVGAS